MVTRVIVKRSEEADEERLEEEPAALPLSLTCATFLRLLCPLTLS